MSYISEYINKLQVQEMQPGFSIKLKMSEKNKGDGFSIDRRSRGLVIESENSLGAAYGLNCASVGCASGHLAEYQGRNDPLFSLRPVWFIDYNFLLLDQVKTEKICRRLIQWGYNAVVAECRFVGNFEINFASFDMFHRYGLKIILKPVFLDEKFQGIKDPWILNSSMSEKLQGCLSIFAKNNVNIDYLFWEAHFFNDAVKRNHSYTHMLSRDLALEEVRHLESLAKAISLIYYIPCSSSSIGIEQWLPEFFDDVSNNTIISFSAAADKEDYLLANPLWEKLRKMPDTSSTRLLPIINGGLVDQGNGLWPVLPLDILDAYLPRCYRHSFAGAIITAKYLPKKNGWLDAALWISGQSLWNKSHASLKAETWFAAFRHDIHYSSISSIISQISKLSLLLRRLQTWQGSVEGSKILAESITSQLKDLHTLVNAYTVIHGRKHDFPSFPDYFAFFDQDVRKILSQYLPSSRHLSFMENVGSNELIRQMIIQQANEDL